MKRKLTGTTLLLTLWGTAGIFGELSYDYLDEIMINGAPIEDYNQLFLEYEIDIPFFTVPEVTATTDSPHGTVFVEQAESLPGTAYLELRDGPATINTYQVHFSTVSEKIFQKTFENDEIGSIPDGLEIEGSGVKVVESPAGEGRVLFVDKSSEGSSLQATFPRQEGIVVIERSFLLPGTTGTYPILTVGDERAVAKEGIEGVAIAIEARNGDFVYRTGEESYQRIFPAARENHWYHIKVVSDVAAGTSDVFIDHWRRVRTTGFLGQPDGIDRAVSHASSDAGYHLKDILVYKPVP